MSPLYYPHHCDSTVDEDVDFWDEHQMLAFFHEMHDRDEEKEREYEAYLVQKAAQYEG
jgi:hypothetical protein